MGTLRMRAGLVALACALLAVITHTWAVCLSSDVDVWFAGGQDEAGSYIRKREEAGYRLVYTSIYPTSTDLRVNVIMIRDSSIKSRYELNALADDVSSTPSGFCDSSISGYGIGDDYITSVYEKCDSINEQDVWFGMSKSSFLEKADELHDEGYNLRSFSGYGCKSCIRLRNTECQIHV